jgi:hypothetical protein
MKDLPVTLILWFRHWPDSPMGWVQIPRPEAKVGGVEYWKEVGYRVAQFQMVEEKDA